MARLPACNIPCRNPPPTGEDKLASLDSTDGSDTYTPGPAVSRDSTPAPPPAPLLASTSAVDSMVGYSEADFQRIFRTVLEARPPVPPPQPLVFPDGPCEKPLKARFLELYRGKTHVECYNFIQQYEDHFATAGV